MPKSLPSYDSEITFKGSADKKVSNITAPISLIKNHILWCAVERIIPTNLRFRFIHMRDIYKNVDNLPLTQYPLLTHNN
jgi:hypothetical protein